MREKLPGSLNGTSRPTRRRTSASSAAASGMRRTFRDFV